jgi:hypothetical protein
MLMTHAYECISMLMTHAYEFISMLMTHAHSNTHLVCPVEVQLGNVRHDIVEDFIVATRDKCAQCLQGCVLVCVCVCVCVRYVREYVYVCVVLCVWP